MIVKPLFKITDQRIFILKNVAQVMAMDMTRQPWYDTLVKAIVKGKDFLSSIDEFLAMAKIASPPIVG